MGEVKEKRQKHEGNLIAWVSRWCYGSVLIGQEGGRGVRAVVVKEHELEVQKTITRTEAFSQVSISW